MRKFMTGNDATCVHCGQVGNIGRRDLCKLCYRQKHIRRLYPRVWRDNRVGAGLVRPANPIPFVPTTALPGTLAKILVIEERLANCLPLFHPDDARPSKGILPERETA